MNWHLSATRFGALGKYLDKPWSRQAVHQAERGRRAFTAAEMAALALVLDTSAPALFLADATPIELPGATVSAEDYRGILLYAGDDAPLDGVGELLVALRDIGQILSRPTLARLAKIEQVAEEVADVGRGNDGGGGRGLALGAQDRANGGHHGADSNRHRRRLWHRAGAGRRAGGAG